MATPIAGPFDVIEEDARLRLGANYAGVAAADNLAAIVHCTRLPDIGEIPASLQLAVFELVAYSSDELERYFEHLSACEDAIAASGVIFSAYGIEVRTNSVAIGLVMCDHAARSKVRNVLGEGPWTFYEQPLMTTE